MERIFRDDEGNVSSLRLSRMQLSSQDFAAIGRLKTLRSIAWDGTNVSDADSRQLRRLPNLEGLSLSSTENIRG